MAIGQAGSLSTNSPTENAPITVTFDEPLTNPVIALTATNNGGNQFTMRVIDVTDTGFTFIIEEWEYHDGPHGATETINWLAIEEGVHTLPDGRVIEAGTTSADTTNSAVSLTGGFTDPPVVLTSVMSENDTTTVDSDPLDITTSGFNLRLQEEEAQDNIHAPETVGWIAIQGGGDGSAGTAVTSDILDNTPDTFGLGASYTNGVVLAETQTINGGDPGTVVIDGATGSTVDLFFEEEQSADGETNHVDETVGIVAFENGLIPCFTPGARIDTPFGPRAVETLQAGDLVLTRDHGPQPLRWVCRTDLSAMRLAVQPHRRPIRIKAGALGPDMPARDMMVSPQHRILVSGWKAQLFAGCDEVLVPARALLRRGDNGKRPRAPVSYIHLLLEDHQVLSSDGLWSESLHAGQLSKAELHPAARAELLELFPDLRCFERNYGPTARQVSTVQEGRLLVA